MTPFLQERRVLRFRAAGFWRRAAGALIDGSLVGVVLGVLLWAMWATSWPQHTEVQHFGIDYLLELLLGDSYTGLAVGAALLLVAQAYFVIFHMWRGQTLGEQAVGVRLVTNRGVAPGFLRAVGRAWGSLVGFACLGVGVAWIAFDREKRGLGDFIGGTHSVIHAGAAAKAAGWV